MLNIAIIGAGFGDEGKGLATDYCADLFNGDCTVIRYNGSSQCGHTVVTPDEKKHTFSHFGCGSFTGAGTYFDNHAVVNPMLFCKELSEIKRKFGIIPKIDVNSLCQVTTPYDIMINQILEISRGEMRHGSCGHGFGETIERHRSHWFSTKYSQLLDLIEFDKFESEMRFIRDKWVPQRIKEIGLKNIPEEYQRYLKNDNIIKNYYKDWITFSRTVDQNACPIGNGNLIFEGGQGLLLDQDHEFFPYVTRSKTGLNNIELICNKADIHELDVIFVTRAYTTRHGAGPLPYELGRLPYEHIHETTNKYHQFQGKLRYSYLNLDLILDGITKELSTCKLKLDCTLLITCMDQLNSNLITCIYEGSEIKIYPSRLEEIVLEWAPEMKFLYSWGPTRNDIKEREQ